MSIEIRHATEKDLPRLIAMGRRFWDCTAYRDIVFCPDSMAQTFRELMANEMLFVSEEDGVLTGAIGSVISPLFANRAHFFATELFWWVEPEHRASGAARLLLKALENAARDRGVTINAMLLLDTLKPEKLALAYKRMGYRPAERTFMRFL